MFAKAIARVLVVVLANVCAAPGPAVAADAPEHWQATSTTAVSVTGNVTFTSNKITFENGRSLALSLVDHVSGFKEMGETADATIYRVTIPVDLILKNGNHLCGGHRSALVTYIAAWVPDALPGDKAPRSMAAFSGKKPPRSADSTSCGIYNYDAGG